ncbi:MAG TPA: hypothetical protein VNB64_08215 [Solirubrobacteraceae bacterium]|nr:hypothetical protein [Solirubrobacteraceae bacterium]
MPMLRLEDAEEVLGFAPTKFGSTALDPETLPALLSRFGMRVERGDLKSFLDFDVDEHPSAGDVTTHDSAEDLLDHLGRVDGA